MRISDWSSDVCSSDLAPNHRTPWRADVPGALVTATLWALLSLGFRAYLALAPGANQVFGSLGGALIVLLWIYLLALGLLVGGEVNAIRSEEHTSELQSLMRNSYAVFCLKKKKHIDTTQHD